MCFQIRVLEEGSESAAWFMTGPMAAHKSPDGLITSPNFTVHVSDNAKELISVAIIKTQIGFIIP